MALCLRYHKKEGDLCMILQIEFESKQNANDNSRKKTKESKSKKNFSHSDESILKIVSTFLQLRLEKHMLNKDVKKKVADRSEAIQMASRICKLKTYKALMKGMHRELIQFLSF